MSAAAADDKTHPRLRESPFPMIPVSEALRLVLEQTKCLQPALVPLASALNRILAEDIKATEPFPPFPASVMDGYAVVSSDGAGVYPVSASVTAGISPEFVLQKGQVAYVTTGAPVPAGADAVIEVERTKAVDGKPNHVELLAASKPGTFIRPIGSDMAVGELILPKGQLITPAEIGLLASIGKLQVPVFVAPRVSILSTGDELVTPNEQPTGGKIRDSNTAMLVAAVIEAGGHPIAEGIARDKDGDIEKQVQACLQHCDMLITTGGVSMGSLDLVKPLLGKIGKVHFGRINMKPGKPSTFATVDVPTAQGTERKLVFALPGNPVSSLVTFHLLAEPAIWKMAGKEVSHLESHPVVDAITTSDLAMDPIRPEYHRATLYWDHEKGSFMAVSTGKQASSRLLNTRSANAYLLIPAKENGVIPQGTKVPAMLVGNLLHAPIPRPVDAFGRLTTNPLPTITVSGAANSSGCHHTHGHSHGTGHGHAHQHSHAESKVGSSPAPAASAPSGHSHASAAESAQCDHPHCRAAASATKVKVAVLTVSDRCSQGKAVDKSGPLAKEWLLNFNKDHPNISFDVVDMRVVPDEIDAIQKAILSWTDRDNPVELVLTTGGTGFTPRDVTPEATRPLLEKVANGLEIAIISASMKIVPTAILSRPACGIRKKSLIINLPGSSKAVVENLDILSDALPHGLKHLQSLPDQH